MTGVLEPGEYCLRFAQAFMADVVEQPTSFFSMQFRYLFVCFVALRPKSTAMVIAGRSVHLTTLFPGQA